MAAVTEVIKTQGGKETETEYFAALVSIKFELVKMLEVFMNFKKKYPYTLL